ncbi:hypothetical protein ACFPOA_00465 [Lysobacter niabensis]|uniref:hypothetical protein n=1 Tax=Agrilutibacter niabensis TaxID=380628 RepID=UPI003610E625
MNPQDFAIHPANARLIWLVPGLSMLAAVIGIGFLLAQEPRAWIALPAILASLGLMTLVFRRRRVSLADGILTVAAGLNTRRVATGELELASARIVDLRERSDFKPMFKVFGTRVPGLSMGHFRLRDRSRAFVLLTDASRVLVLNERSGRRLLLSLDRPQTLLDALKAAPRS